MPVELRDGPDRPSQPLGALGRAAERARGRLRIGERGNRERAPAQRRGRAFGAAMNRCKHRLVGPGSAAAPLIAAADVRRRRPRRGGTKRTITASIPGSARTSGSDGLVAVGCRRAEHVDRVRGRRLGREERRERGRGSPRRAAGNSRPAASQASAQGLPQPAQRFGQSGDPPAPRSHGWLERRAATSRSSTRVSARSTPAWRKTSVDGGVGSGEGCRM